MEANPPGEGMTKFNTLDSEQRLNTGGSTAFSGNLSGRD